MFTALEEVCLVECYWPGVDPTRAAQISECLHSEVTRLRAAGESLDFLWSLLMPGDEAIFCLFRGAIDDARACCERCGMPVERVVESSWLTLS